MPEVEKEAQPKNGRCAKDIQATDFLASDKTNLGLEPPGLRTEMTCIDRVTRVSALAFESPTLENPLSRVEFRFEIEYRI